MISDYNRAIAKRKTSHDKNVLQNLPIEIQWNDTFKLKEKLLFIPVTLKDTIHMKDDDGNVLLMNRRVHLQAKYNDGWQFSINAVLPNKYSKNNSFSGKMISSSMFSSNLNFTNYFQGKPLQKNQDLDGKIKVKASNKAAYIQVCHSVNAYVKGYFHSKITYCDEYYYPDGGGMGNEPGDWQNFNPPGYEDMGGGQPIIAPDSTLKKLPNKLNSCNGKEYLNEVGNLSVIKNKFALLKAKVIRDGNEHADLSYMNLSSKIVLSSSDQFEGTRNGVEHKERWYVDNGEAYATTIYTHTHGFVSAPTPVDAFAGIKVYLDNSSQSLSLADKATYLQYLTAFTITPEHVYSITIKDTQKWVQ